MYIRNFVWNFGVADHKILRRIIEDMIRQNQPHIGRLGYFLTSYRTDFANIPSKHNETFECRQEPIYF